MALLHQTVTSLRNIKMFFMRGKPCVHRLTIRLYVMPTPQPHSTPYPSETPPTAGQNPAIINPAASKAAALRNSFFVDQYLARKPLTREPPQYAVMDSVKMPEVSSRVQPCRFSKAAENTDHAYSTATDIKKILQRARIPHRFLSISPPGQDRPPCA